MLLKTVIGLLVLTSVSAADWTIEIFACDFFPSCQDAVTYVPGETFVTSLSEPSSGAAYRYELLLEVTKTTTLKFLSAGSCDCPGQHFVDVDSGYFWRADDCYDDNENCVYEEIVEVTPGPYFIDLRYAGVFSISNAEPTPEPVAGDFDGDGDLDVDDYNSIGNSLGLCASDTNRDSIVDFSDLLMVINDWGTTCE
ncbi:MAG: hypothetical protein VXZ30_00280 [Planctomycetota bacterium]|nr:hypothetical protein [Planctomycetota bacterium]